jgi:hypothetical protein
MTDPENPNRTPWNPEVAIPLFGEFAAMHRDSGILEGYNRGIQKYLEDFGDQAETAETIRALQGDTALAVIAEEDPDEGAPGHKEMYLVKVDPQDGIRRDFTDLYTGYVLDETVDALFVGQVETEPAFTPEQADLLRQQYRRQEEAGLHLG